MPFGSSSMELSDPVTPDTSVDMDGTANRRKSGRAKQKPVLLNKDPNIPPSSITSGGKRKRADSRVDEIDEVSDADEEESSANESDPDEEELKEQRRKARSRKPSSKPATKKVKNGPGLTTNLAVRPAVNGAKKPAKPRQPRARPVKNRADDGTGLYSEIFSHGHTLEAVAADWITRWEQDNTEAMRELVNLLLKCTGCDIQVDTHDIEDPDNVVSKLSDIQDEYQAQKITDYPLISRAKGNASFRATMTGFFETLINTCHASGLLYSDTALYENLDLWVTTMTSATIRPFRHTATVVSLSMGSALCTVANDLAENTAKTARQKEGEQKKKSVNKERVKALDTKIVEEGKKRSTVIYNLTQIFDSTYVHRYRDVDPKIRVDCVTAMGTWISTLPDHFFEGIYLRYLGWVLSDTFALTRAEVIKQLARLFRNKENVARLRTFTERFRGRMVEMAVRDSEINVRAATVALLDTIRKTGLLEPDDIDNVGRLIFDAEPRVRKAVAGFFAENINDLFESTLEDFGGEEGIAEVLGEEVEDDYDVPRLGWLKLKCIAEALQSYDAEDEEEIIQGDRGGNLISTGGDSRYALAAQTICDGIPEAKEWEILAGYLLYDFSAVDDSSAEGDAPFKSRCKLDEREVILLLEVLNAAVKSRLSETLDGESDKKGKRTKAQREEAKAVQEAAALHLAEVIPRLLKKYGANPATATTVLRLEHVLNMEIFQELRQDSTKYATLLDDINKQFLSHADQGVLTEASTALLHARAFEDLEEVTTDKMKDLWDDTINALRTLMANGAENNIPNLCHTVRRIENLASITDCTEAFDHEARAPSKKKSSKTSTASPLSLLIDIIRDPALDSEAGDEADDLLISTTKSLLFYYMWTARALKISISTNYDPIDFLPDYSAFSQALISLIESRHALSPVRTAATGVLLDLHTLFTTFRHLDTQSSRPLTIDTSPLIQPLPTPAQSLILTTFTALEKSYAKKSHKTLEAATNDDLASDPEDSSDDEDDDDNDDAKQAEALLAEKSLCEIAGKMVLAIVARVLDHNEESSTSKPSTIRERLQRNKTRLGNNFKEVLSYLDPPKPPAKGRLRPAPTKKKQPAGSKGGKKGKSKEVVSEDEDSDEEDGRRGRFEEGGEEDLRERELVEDRIVDPDGEGEDGGGVNARGGAVDEEEEVEDDDVMGD